MKQTLIPTDKIDVRRIALVADTHAMRDDASDFPARALEALAGVELIVHCGDPGHVAVLDRLASVAPVLGVRGGHVTGDGSAPDQRLADTTRVIEAGGLRIAVIHEIGKHGTPVSLEGGRLSFTPHGVEEAMRSRFGARVDVVAFGGTHAEMVAFAGGVLFVNPGSPNLPAGRERGSLGTIALLDVVDGVATVRVVDLG
jgi:hypothetical protein